MIDEYGEWSEELYDASEVVPYTGSVQPEDCLELATLDETILWTYWRFL